MKSGRHQTPHIRVPCHPPPSLVFPRASAEEPSHEHFVRGTQSLYPPLLRPGFWARQRNVYNALGCNTIRHGTIREMKSKSGRQDPDHCLALYTSVRGNPPSVTQDLLKTNGCLPRNGLTDKTFVKKSLASKRACKTRGSGYHRGGYPEPECTIPAPALFRGG